jgi:hypothetical protein
MSTKFLEGNTGGQSNSRLIADVMILCALVMSFLFIWIGVKYKEVDLMKIATAIGVVYGSVGGTAMTFLFFQKWNERKEGSRSATQIQSPAEPAPQIQPQ